MVEIKEPKGMEELVYFTNRNLGNGKARVWVFKQQCEKCKKIFTASPEHLALTVCDKCGRKLIKRKDDSSEGIKSRMNEFRKYVLPVLKYFRKEKLLRSVDGEQSITNVHKDISKILMLK